MIGTLKLVRCDCNAVKTGIIFQFLIKMYVNVLSLAKDIMQNAHDHFANDSCEYVQKVS